MNKINKKRFSPEIEHKNFDVFDVYKGNDTRVVEVDVEELEEIIKSLRKVAKVKTSELKGDDRKNLDKIISYVSVLYDTDSYKILYGIAMKHWSDLKIISPGTVGSYFAGCIRTSSSSDMQGCEVICAGSMPRPNESDEWKQCDKAVIWGKYHKGKYSFNVLQNNSDMSHSILHINCTNYNTCPKFSPEDIDTLKSIGVETITLRGYKNNGRDHLDLIGKEISVDDLVTNENGKESSHTLTFIVIGFLIFAFCLWQSKYFGLDIQKYLQG
ncbi:MAG: hypothetical protein COA94_07195 [Rickettsiales bacterium]|nr:MAG: hypothetical protein COA94_07195 [Rickettsiales bacterium]